MWTGPTSMIADRGVSSRFLTASEIRAGSDLPPPSPGPSRGDRAISKLKQPMNMHEMKASQRRNLYTSSCSLPCPILGDRLGGEGGGGGGAALLSLGPAKGEKD